MLACTRLHCCSILCDLYYAIRRLDAHQYKPALELIETLLAELKRLDDKMILTEVHLLESRVYRGIGNLAKAKVDTIQMSVANSVWLTFRSLLLPQRAPPQIPFTALPICKRPSTFSQALFTQRTRTTPLRTRTSSRPLRILARKMTLVLSAP